MSTDDALIRYWYARLPKGLAPLFPRVATALGDGGWTTAWVRIAAWAPLVVFGVGLFVPRTWPGTQVVYAESPLFLGFAVALSIISGTWGVALLLANGLREVLSHDMASSLSAVIHVGAGQLVVWLLLGVLLVMLPQFAHLLTEAGVVRMPFLRNSDVRSVCRALLLAVIYPCLVLMWCQAVTVLIRPVFAWSGGNPSVGALSTVGEWWPWMAAAAAGAALVRGILEGVVAPRMRLATYPSALKREREASARRPGSALDDMPDGVRIAVATAGMTILLAGMFEHPEDGVVAGLLIGLLAMLARGVGAEWLTGGWAIGMDRMPGVVRVAVAIGCGYLLTDRALAFEWSGTALRAMMLGTLFTLGLLFVLFPALDVRPWRAPVPRRRR
jgi:hypothetical protein